MFRIRVLIAASMLAGMSAALPQLDALAVAVPLSD
jgi:hypothetical protein